MSTSTNDPRPLRTFAPWKDPNARPIARFENVTKKFGDFTAVNNLTQDIFEKEFFALLGPSGCGKSTLLRLLAGFETPTSGRIFLDGQDIADVPAHKRPVNMMFQSYALFPHMTVARNIAFGLKQEGALKSHITRRVDEMLELVQMEPFADRKPHQLSGGQRQRVALARSLAKRPKILLLDEPLGALDAKLREQTQFELMGLQETTGVTFIIVTHDQEEAMTVSDRIAVMLEGEIVQVASPAEIYEFPGSRYVADFIGDVNIIEGRIARASDERIDLAWHEDHRELQTTSGNENASAGSTAWLAIRPEKIRISRARGDHAGENQIPGKVLDIGYLGNITTYHVEIAKGLVIKALEANRAHLVDRAITWDDDVWLTWPAAAGVLLDR